ncbi:hypothetical protein EVG20_g8145 [Dentipellis fragilis]|uniref:Fungal-type protein kinase domain-containing protein n=1 Tax=Dentipellis fragilis TaxID=205917 RepID=A0A4Y9Y7G2_9AGAM|nr:hypothetical protein EVG20_g8145 [Dentipellis fragilis]
MDSFDVQKSVRGWFKSTFDGSSKQRRRPMKRTLTKGAFDDVPSKGPEAHACLSICEAVNRMLHGMKLDGYVLKATGNTCEASPDDRTPGLYFSRRDDETVFTRIIEKTPYDNNQATVDLAHMISPIEVQLDKDPKSFEYSSESETDSVADSHGEMARYATEVLRRQHRQFVVSAFIQNSTVRFYRWDRAGVIVSEPVDFHAEPEHLMRFFYWLALADRDQGSGYDTTVARATAEDIQHLETFKHTLDHSIADDPPAVVDAQTFYLEHVKAILDNQINYPVYKVNRVSRCAWNRGTPAGISCEPRMSVFLVGIPIHATASPTGRGTKTFAAYDIGRRRLVLLKGSWIADGTHPELEVYEQLKHHKVEHVATAIAGGFVGEQATISHEDQDGASRRRHYRLVTLELGRKLKTFKDQRELINAVRDSLEAHEEAWKLGNILHCDVSANNIMIDITTGRGFLNDWDQCKFRDELCQGTIRSRRSGTWMYMSAILLKYPRKPHELSDDLESFVHVLTVMALRFSVHSLSSWTIEEVWQGSMYEEAQKHSPGLEEFINMVYNSECMVNGYAVGGSNKMFGLRLGNPNVEWVDSDSPLISLIARLYNMFSQRYSALDKRQYESEWGVTTVGFIKYKSGPLPRGPANSRSVSYHSRRFALSLPS